jgi:hypothetical protein
VSNPPASVRFSRSCSWPSPQPLPRSSSSSNAPPPHVYTPLRHLPPSPQAQPRFGAAFGRLLASLHCFSPALCGKRSAHLLAKALHAYLADASTTTATPPPPPARAPMFSSVGHDEDPLSAAFPPSLLAPAATRVANALANLHALAGVVGEADSAGSDDSDGEDGRTRSLPSGSAETQEGGSINSSGGSSGSGSSSNEKVKADGALLKNLAGSLRALWEGKAPPHEPKAAPVSDAAPRFLAVRHDDKAYRAAGQLYWLAQTDALHSVQVLQLRELLLILFLELVSWPTLRSCTRAH